MIQRPFVLLAITVLSASSLMAQRPNTREAFWIGFGVGAGTVGAECNTCDDDDRRSGLSGYFRAGGTVSPHVQLGGELLGWNSSSNDIDYGLGVASFVALIYPSARGAFFLKFGIGGMTYSQDDGSDEIEARAPGLSFGLGNDFRVADNFALTPYVNVFASAPVRFSINGIDVPAGQELKLNLVQFGLGFHWF